ncbi:MAG: hypothetical protein IPK77_04065 [Cellvibrio sp.]|nr:hypothetical protein [Cellvibrio sp.]
MSLYEIVELSNGDVVLRRVDDESSEPFVRIQFSEESLNYLGGSKFEVAKSMIEAGMDAANEETQDQEFHDAQEETDHVEGYVLH